MGKVWLDNPCHEDSDREVLLDSNDRFGKIDVDGGLEEDLGWRDC